MAFVTVLFRPFPWEAPNAAALVLSFEGIAFVGLVIWRFGSVRKAVTSMFSNPYLIFVIVYFVMWALALTVIGNFSLLARQRLMLFPAFFMLLAYFNTADPRNIASLFPGEADAQLAQRASPTTLKGDAN